MKTFITLLLASTVVLLISNAGTTIVPIGGVADADAIINIAVAQANAYTDSTVTGGDTNTIVTMAVNAANDYTDVATNSVYVSANRVSYGFACSDETTAITATTNKVTFRMPHAMTVTAVRASLATAQASGNIFTIDVNEGATSILSTKITVDNTEKTSTTADAAPVISDATLADDAEITIDVDQIGNGSATGLKVWLIGTR